MSGRNIAWVMAIIAICVAAAFILFSGHETTTVTVPVQPTAPVAP